MSKLTIKQKKFVEEYIISGNATEAALKAGYKNGVSGRENLQKHTIIEALKKKEEAIQSKKIASQEEVLEYLTSILRGEQEEKTLIGTGKGAQRITNIEVSAKDRIKAAELLGKRYGTWTDKIDIEGDVNIVLEDDYGD